jgi:hypothetical protein
MNDDVKALTEFQSPPNTEIHVDPPPAEIDPFSQRLVELAASLPDWLRQYLDFQVQAKYAYEIPYRCRQEFLWQRSPFQMQCYGWLPQHVLPGVDYLLAYWMGRYYGYLDPHDIDPPADDDNDDASPVDDDDNDDNGDDNDLSPADDDNDDAASGGAGDDDSSGCGC